MFDEREGNSIETLYGYVTTGTDGKFLKLIGPTVYIDAIDYFIKEVELILGIVVSTLQVSY